MDPQHEESAGCHQKRLQDERRRYMDRPAFRLRYLDENEEAALLRELDPETPRAGLKPLETRNSELHRNLQDNYDIVIALLDSGFRDSEIANIPWSAVNVEGGTIHVYRSKVSKTTIST